MSTGNHRPQQQIKLGGALVSDQTWPNLNSMSHGLVMKQEGEESLWVTYAQSHSDIILNSSTINTAHFSPEGQHNANRRIPPGKSSNVYDSWGVWGMETNCPWKLIGIPTYGHPSLCSQPNNGPGPVNTVRADHIRYYVNFLSPVGFGPSLACRRGLRRQA
jgi:hypothetical protein